MKKYHINNCGCDDWTEFDIELTDEELATVIKVLNANNKVADYCCKPSIYIHNFIEGARYYDNDTALNKNYHELNKEEK